MLCSVFTYMMLGTKAKQLHLISVMTLVMLYYRQKRLSPGNPSNQTILYTSFLLCCDGLL